MTTGTERTLPTDSNVDCARKERRRCNHPDANYCCGGGHDGCCNCACHTKPVWQPMETAPKGVLIEGLDSDGNIDHVEYRETRQCMLSTVAKGAGECGPGWVSRIAGNLPIDPPDFWREIATCPM